MGDILLDHLFSECFQDTHLLVTEYIEFFQEIQSLPHLPNIPTSI